MDTNINNIFSGGLGDGVEVAQTEEVAVDKEKKSARREQLAQLKEAYRETLEADEELRARRKAYSQFVSVVNTFGFGDKGNVIVDPTKTSSRGLTEVSKIVGYRIKNEGTVPINYRTEEYVKGADGLYVGTPVTKVLAPGGTADLTRQYMTMFCAEIEIAFELKNGILVKGSGSKASKDLKSKMEAMHFRFNSDANMAVNDDDIKINIGEKIKDTWVVKKEYVKTFGFLNNPKQKTGRKGSKGDFSSQELSAFYIRQLLEEEGIN